MALSIGKYRFYHIPKTGGNYIRKVMLAISTYKGLSLVERGHAHCGPLRILPYHDFERSFCVVREPIEWYKSFYRYRVQNGWKDDHPVDIYCKADSFDEFICNILKIWNSKDGPGYVTSLYLRFVPFCKFILPMNNLTPSLKKLFAMWRLPFPSNVPPENATSKAINTELSKPTFKSIRASDNDIRKYLKLETPKWRSK